ncbi:MAG: glycosyltransferase [Lapillicoccus sp.]
MNRHVVAGLVPAYDPPAGLVDLVADLMAQTGAVVVVDDGSSAPGATEVLDRCARLGAVVIRLPTNAGIAAALNHAVSQAISTWPDLDAVVTVDQDSRLGERYVERLLTAWDAALAVGVAVMLVGPEHVQGLPSRVRGRRGDVLLGREPVQSGLLIPTAVLAGVGPFDETLVIDGVDTDFSLRCLDTGGVVVVAADTSIGHRLGAGHEVRLLGRPVVVGGRPLVLTVSAPFRYYYLTRNRLRLVRRYARRHPGWAVGQLLGLGRHLALVLTLVPGRRRRAREAWHGVRDGVRDVGGRRPDSDGGL